MMSQNPMRSFAKAVLLTCALLGAQPATAQKYFMRAKLAGVDAKPVEYTGSWYKTGELTYQNCVNGSRSVDWELGCRSRTNYQKLSISSCDPAQKPAPDGYSESCTAVCGDLGSPGYVIGNGAGNMSSTVDGTFEQMKMKARRFCETANMPAGAPRACSLRLNAPNATNGWMYAGSATDGRSSVTVLSAPDSWYGSCTGNP